MLGVSKDELNAFFVEPHHSLREVMKKIDHHGHGVAVVVDSTQQFLGLVTDGDIRRAIIKGFGLSTLIDAIMNKSAISLQEGFSRQEVIQLLHDKDINHLPIVNQERKITNLVLRSRIEASKQSHFSSSFFPSPEKGGRRILVVGGAGYIGSVLVGKLLARGYKVVVLDLLLFGREAIEPHFQNENFTLIQGDIGNINNIIAATKDVDAVVQLGEIVGDPACAVDSQKTQQVNFLSTQLVAHVCKYFQINRFIYTSSCSVYGESLYDELLTEESKLNPVSLYARMKIQAEQAILSMDDGFFSPTIFRLSTVFGVSPRMRFDLVVNVLTAKGVKERKLTVFGGDQWRPFVHVEDVAQAIILALESPLEKVRGQIFNVGTEKNNLTIHHVAEAVSQKIPGVTISVNEQDVDQRNYRVSFSKIRDELGFVAKWSVPEGITEIMGSLEKGRYDDYTHAKYSNYKTYLDKMEE